MPDENEELSKVFIAEEILPDPSKVFTDEPLGIEKAIDDADIVLDTNVLLIPYGAGASSLSQISEVYEGIKKKNRLCIPGQVAREFAKNRPKKLAELFKGISDKVSMISLPEKLSYPILESVKEFQDINNAILKIANLKTEIKVANRAVRSAIKNWECNDPVSQAYRLIFSEDIVISPTYDQATVLSEMTYRYKHGIPPGYKDASKPDSGIGDYVIWKTILHLGETNKRSVIFVSGDEKADWQHGSDGSGFLPRYELQAEFRKISNGKDLYIIPLSRLLELQKAEETSVDEIRTEEKRIRESVNVEAECPECNVICEYELDENIGSSALPSCGFCDSKFHLHRTSSGVIVHALNKSTKKISPSLDKELELFTCPNCGDLNFKELGVSKNSTAWCICDNCNSKFPIHRKKDGSVYANDLYENG